MRGRRFEFELCTKAGFRPDNLLRFGSTEFHNISPRGARRARNISADKLVCIPDVSSNRIVGHRQVR